MADTVELVVALDALGVPVSGEFVSPAQLAAVEDLIPQSPADIGAATEAQGVKADSAVQPAQLEGVANSIPSTPGDIGAATAAQGAKADSAIQQAALDSAIATRATAAQGAKADTAIQQAALDSAIATRATAAQGALADTAVQPAAISATLDAIGVKRAALSKTSSMVARAVAVSSARKAVSPYLDGLTATAKGVWGLTRARSAYTGPCLRARRISDSAVKDFGFLPDNIVDTDSMIAWAGASSLTLVTLYDQSGTAGNVYDATQEMASLQPNIDFTWLRNGMPVIYFANAPSKQFLSIPSALTIAATNNCAAFAAIGNFSTRVGGTPFCLGTTGQFELSLLPSSAFSVQPKVNGVALNFGNPNMATIPNANGCVVGLNSLPTGTNPFYYYRNDTFFQRAVAANIATAGGQICALGPLDMFGLCVFDGAPSIAEATHIQYAMTRAHACVLTPKANVVLCGDSLVASAVSNNHNYIKAMANYLPPNVSIINVGLGGQTLQSEAGEVSNRCTGLFRAGIPNIGINWGGVNDITLTPTITPETLYGYMTTWQTAMKAAGFIAIQGLLYNRAVTGSYTSAMQATRIAYNNLLRANYGPGKFLAGIIDPELEPTFSTLLASDSGDNLHLNTQGYGKAAPLLFDEIADKLYGLV